MAKGFIFRVFSICIILLIILTCTYLFLHSSFFSIEKIYVTGLQTIDESEILQLSELHVGKNIFMTNTRYSSKAIEIHPMVKEAVIIRHLPREIEINILEREMWALMPHGDMVLCIDAEGICLDKLSNRYLPGYPIITMEDIPVKVNIGQAIEPEGVMMIRQIWDTLTPEIHSQISDYHYLNSSKELVLYTIKGTEVRFGDLERLEEKTNLIQAVFQIEEDMEVEGIEVLEYVDLRFKGQPVIKIRE